MSAPVPSKPSRLGDRMGRDGAGGRWPQPALTPPALVGPRAHIEGDGDGDEVGAVP